jgi:hypothetical protein
MTAVVPIRADHVGAGDFRAQISKMIAMKMQVSAADVLMLKNVKLAGLQSGDFQHGSPFKWRVIGNCVRRS